MQYINDDDILYFEGEHIINIVKEPDISRRIYSKRIIKSSNTEDFNANYFWYGKGFELTVPYGYRLVNSFYTHDNYMVYTFVNEVPVIVENGRNIPETVIGTPHINTNMKLTKYKKY